MTSSSYRDGRCTVSRGGEMCQDVTRTDHPSASFGMRIPEDGGTNIAPRASARVVGGGPAELAAYARREHALFGKLIAASGIEKE